MYVQPWQSCQLRQLRRNTLKTKGLISVAWQLGYSLESATNALDTIQSRSELSSCTRWLTHSSEDWASLTPIIPMVSTALEQTSSHTSAVESLWNTENIAGMQVNICVPSKSILRYSISNSLFPTLGLTQIHEFCYLLQHLLFLKWPTRVRGSPTTTTIVVKIMCYAQHNMSMC